MFVFPSVVLDFFTVPYFSAKYSGSVCFHNKDIIYYRRLEKGTQNIHNPKYSGNDTNSKIDMPFLERVGHQGLLFNANLSGMSAISWRESILSINFLNYLYFY
jgi:hypothetical protein